MRIVLSPDENPGDPGTTADPTITERDLNLRVCAALQAALERCDQVVDFDPSITYVDRVQRANSDGSDLLIACAHNAGGGQGMRALVCPGGHTSEQPTWSDGRPNRQDDFANAVGHELEAVQLVDQFSLVDEAVYECCQFRFDSGYFELEFMDSSHDQAIYRQPDYPAKAAEAIARGAAAVYGFSYVSPPAPAPPPEPDPEPPAPPAAPAATVSQPGPVLAAIFGNQLHVFFVDPAGQLQHRWAGGHALTDPGEVLATGLLAGAPLCAAVYGEVLHVFGERPDGKLEHSFSPNGAEPWGHEVIS